MNYYNSEIKEVLETLGSSESGLSTDDAKSRLSKNGPNKLKETKKKGILIKFLGQFKDLMLIILIISAILSALVSVKTGESFTDTIVILFVVVLNAILGVVQESKAEKAIEALKDMSLPYIKVRRDGKVQSIKTEELVVGDMVLIEAGDSIPADMRIVNNHSLRVEEAALTGESVPVDKQQEAINADKETSLADRTNMLYSGSNVVYGRGDAIVIATGMDTELGKIAEAISQQKIEITPLQKKINELSKVLSVIVVVIAVAMFFVGMLEGNPVLEVFMLAISLAVAAIPEGLSAVITITLAMGVQKMAKEKAIVRKLSSVEALGSTEVICSDKTGTLTQNKMTLRKIVVDMTSIDVENVNNLSDIMQNKEVLEKDFNTIMNIAILCNDTSFGEDKGSKTLLGDPTETSLVEFGEKIGFHKEAMEKEYPRKDELPFDSTRKMMTTVNEFNNQYMIFTKGAVESILGKASKILLQGKEVVLTDEVKEKILTENIQMAKDALRVLACAYRTTSKSEIIDKSEEELVFVGLVGMIDPPRKEAKRAVEKCFTAGMVPVMITGDNIDTATAIAKELGILQKGNKAITGIELDKLSDEELYQQVEDIRVYARVSPENKIRIVKAWKKHGKIVAMTGDGVNDAPALKGADIGIGMGITGTEVSKSVSSMVLADDNFATIVVAIKEGRRIYNNIQNVIAYLLASNLAEVLIIFIATLFNKVLLLPIQILWINLVTDTIPAIALGFEREERNIMKQKPRNSRESLFTPFLMARIIVPGVLKAIIIFILYFVLENMYNATIASGAVFVTLSIIELLFAYICRSDRKSVFRIGLLTNKPMLLCMLGAFILQVAIVTIPVLSNWLRIPQIPNNIYIAIICIAILSAILFEFIKIILAKIFSKERKI
ncbi:MAG: cation-translocating P-type ATPase [Clostridia bacterium]|nr:cation-translocating P-type ATPase [Clostridia bacterium]